MSNNEFGKWSLVYVKTPYWDTILDYESIRILTRTEDHYCLQDQLCGMVRLKLLKLHS